MGYLITEVRRRILCIKRIRDLMVELAGFAVNNNVHFRALEWNLSARQSRLR